MTQHLQVFSELIQNISLFMLRDSNTHIQTQPKKKKNFLAVVIILYLLSPLLWLSCKAPLHPSAHIRPVGHPQTPQRKVARQPHGSFWH